MRIFVISLAESTERREHIRRIFEEQQIEFSFFDAIDLRIDRNRYFHHCDEREFLRNTGRTPGTGEIGCFASHLMLWRSCRLLNEPIVIFEDDALPDTRLHEGLTLVQSHIRRLGFVRLQHNRKKSKVAVVRQRKFDITWAPRFPYGSMAYAISPRVADAFIRQSDIFTAPVDTFIKRFWLHRQPLYSLVPGIVHGSRHAETSTLNNYRLPPAGVLPGLLRWMRKRQEYFSRAAFNLRWLWQYRRSLGRGRPATAIARSEAVAEGQVHSGRRQR